MERQAEVHAGADPDVEVTVVVEPAVGPWSLVLEDGRSFDLSSTSVVVGRSPRQPDPGVQTVDVRDEGATLSKTHARLDLVDGTWQVTDLGSTNGVVVAGADGQDVQVPRGGTAPVVGHLRLGTLGAQIVATAPSGGTSPAPRAGATEPLASSEVPEPEAPPRSTPTTPSDGEPVDGQAAEVGALGSSDDAAGLADLPEMAAEADVVAAPGGGLVDLLEPAAEADVVAAPGGGLADLLEPGAEADVVAAPARAGLADLLEPVAEADAVAAPGGVGPGDLPEPAAQIDVVGSSVPSGGAPVDAPGPSQPDVGVPVPAGSATELLGAPLPGPEGDDDDLGTPPRGQAEAEGKAEAEATERESGLVRQFVTGTMPLAEFVRLLHRDLALRRYLAAGGGLEAYAQEDLLGQLLRTGWQDVAAVRRAQRLLERFLRDQGVVVDPTGVYQEREDAHELLRSLVSELQPPWLTIPAPYLARLVEECGNQVDGDLEDLVRRRIESRFRCLSHPPRWLHEECWPVGRHGPLVFVDQVDIVPDRPGTAVNYVFVDPRSGALLVLPQVRPEPTAEAAPPASPEVQIPRGVVPVLARPGAFWLPSTGRRRAGDGQAGDAEPTREQTPPPGSEPGQAQPSGGLTVASATAEPGPSFPSADAPLVVAPPAPGQVAPGIVPVEPSAPVTVSVEPPAAPVVPEPAYDGDLEAAAATAPPPFRPWTLVMADGRTFAVTSRTVVVGRRPQAAEPGVQVVAIADSTRSLSKTHARLDLVGGTWHVTDLGSTNGVVVTAVDGQEARVEPGRCAPVYGYVAFGSVEARLQPDPAA